MLLKQYISLDRYMSQGTLSMAKKPDFKGLDPSHVEYLTSHAQEMHGPDDFDEEVQKHLDAMASEPNEAENEVQENKQAIRNLSFSPKPPQPPMAPSGPGPQPLQ